MTLRQALIALVFLVSPVLVGAGPLLKLPDTSALVPLLSGGSTDALAGALRGFIVKSLQNPVYETRQDWGRMRPGVLSGKPKKDGHWKHTRVDLLTPQDTLVFDIRDFQQSGPGRFTFTAFLSFDARVEYEVQHWESGIRLRSSSVRARFRARATMNCEATFRLEPGAVALLPDAVFRLHVVKADVKYDNFVTEHIAGLGGDMAEILGDAIRGGLKQFNPSLERDLLAKANAGIEKAADTKEVRVSLYELLKKKGWLGSPPPVTAPAGTPPPPTAPPDVKPLPVDPGWQPVNPPK
ncbi:MAG: hypothetical protein K2R98_16305 [Gemmataceae bacterium]|nr:hypothetical protein [Gemmataceae bacterium]